MSQPDIPYPLVALIVVLVLTLTLGLLNAAGWLVDSDACCPEICHTNCVELEKVDAK